MKTLSCALLLGLPLAVQAASNDNPQAETPPPVPPVQKSQPAPKPPARPASRWWVEADGQPAGPLSVDQLAARLANGQTKPGTLVWKPGMKDWRPLKEVPELAGLLKPAAPVPPPLPKAKAAVNYYLGIGGQRQGPFSLQQVKAKLEAGEIDTTTLVWKKGMAQWQPLSSLEEFQAQAQTPEQGGLPTTAAGLRKFLEGRWRETYADTPELKSYIDMTFRADGSARFHEVNKMQGEPPDESIMHLYWRVKPGTAHAFQIIVGDRPDSPLEDSMVSRVEYVDHDHLRDEDGTIMERIK